MENNLNNNEMNNNYNDTSNYNYEKKNNGVKVLLIIVIVLVLCLIGLLSYKVFVLDKKKQNNKNETKQIEQKTQEFKSSYRMSGNSLEDFDLYFMQLENKEENMVYSPLSIKYALSMLKEGTDGKSKEQIDTVVGDYVSKKYENSKNMSLANALFIRDSYKDSVKTTYIDALKNKYNAEVIYDKFENTNNINKWVSEKTFNLISNLLNSVDNNNFILTNALAIDMEWVKKIQGEDIPDQYYEYFLHENYEKRIMPLGFSGYNKLKFDGNKNGVKSLEIGAVANRYDIVNELGEENIKNKVLNEYKKWIDGGCLERNGKDYCDNLSEEYDIDTYIKELNTGYKKISSSTDFEFYVDNNVKMFAKDLKEYDGSKLQYIGIMPIQEELSKFVKDLDSKKVSNYISNLKEIKLENFDDKVITEIYGYIPMFDFDYELDLIKDLNSLGITDVFDSDKSDLSKITNISGTYISDAAHKANIEFSNDGIKASAATYFGGAGAAGPGPFDYIYEVPVKKIDLTFDKPYIFIIRDKDTGEVWFIGSVYNPTEIKCEDINMDYYGVDDWYIKNCTNN